MVNRRESRRKPNVKESLLREGRNALRPDGTLDTPILVHNSPRHLCSLLITTLLMARIYHSIGLLCFSVLALLHSLVSAHMIEVAAGKKECFFEDLHINDKVVARNCQCKVAQC